MRSVRLTAAIAVIASLPPHMAPAADDAPASWSWDKLTSLEHGQLPPGSWASWTPDQRRAAGRAMFGCVIFGAMSTGSGDEPPRQAKAQASYMSDACIYHTMPADWPGRAKLADRIKTEYSDLHADLPAIPDPQLDGGRAR